MLSKREKDIKDNPKERRYVTDIEFRELNEENEEMILEGYALKFNNETFIGRDNYGYREVILPGALDETNMKTVPLKYNHDGGYLALASTKNNSLELTVDGIGLRFKAVLIATQSNKDVYEMVKSGLLNECSFAFTIDLDDGSEWEDIDGEKPLRKIKKIDRLFDVALVDIPAYENTEVYARSLEKLEGLKETVEAEKRKSEEFKRRMLMKIKLGGIEK